ncbi:unnamed protein product [Meloidogyne enterolobii]|uniref:Uncharacterized protein n=1 Tax=Meloidogyne enterolobii TaxID=390850 RepID=A0ACB1AIQ2_MELEN
MITYYGYVHVFEIETCCSIYRVRISTDPIFITTEHTSNNDGFLAITEYGKVFSVCLDEKTIIPYVTQKLQNPNLVLKLSSRLKLASESKDDAAGKPIPMPWRTESSSEEDENVSEVVKSASRCKIPTTSRTESSSEEDKNVSEVVESASHCNISDDDVVRKFDLLIKNGDYHEAAKLAATAPKNILRTPQTLQKLKEAAPPAKATHSLVIYFTTLLEQGSLNKYESLELCRPVLVQGKKQLVEKWISEGKLECSEELGDLVKQYDVDLATSIYLRGNVPYKVYR